MIGRLGTFAVGVAIGVAIMFVLNRPIGNSDESIETVSTSPPTNDSPGPKAVAQSMTKQSDAASVDNRPTPGSEENASAGDSTLVDAPIRIPRAYRDLVGPIPSPRFEPSEIHALFEKEPRDEAWAFAMETGINDHIANFGAGERTVVEYVECRSQYCEIAGFTDEGHSGGFVRIFGDMKQSGWWQAEGSHQLVGGSDGNSRFVYFVIRHSKE